MVKAIKNFGAAIVAIIMAIVGIVTLRRWRDGRVVAGKTARQRAIERDKIKRDHERRRQEIADDYARERSDFDRMLDGE